MVYVLLQITIQIYVLLLQQSGVNEQPESYATNIYNGPSQQQNQQQQNNYDLSSNKYNPGWKNHPNLRWENPPQQQQQQQQPVPPFQNVVGPSRPYVPPPMQQQQQQQRQQATETHSQPSLEELVRQMTIQNMQFQQETRASI